VLDLACGTGLVSKMFKGRVGAVIGIDLTEAMFRKGLSHTDVFVQGAGEDLPFKSSVFDVALERQGIQFMDAGRAVSEMMRVVRPSGKVCLVQLCAYGREDQEEYFEILRLRNPARRNFFAKGDLERLLSDAGCRKIETIEYISEEDVDRWANNGAISEAKRCAIREIYQKASPAFNRYHAVQIEGDGRIVDRMCFTIAIGSVP